MSDPIGLSDSRRAPRRGSGSETNLALGRAWSSWRETANPPATLGSFPAANGGGWNEQTRQNQIPKTERPKTKLGLPDLDHSKSAVLDSLRSLESKRGYRHAIDEFIQWHCSEPRLSFNKTVVTRYRIFLENRRLAAGTINGRLAAVRRLAYEAADAGLLSPELAAGIRRVKGAKKLGVRLGNWLTAEEARRFWQSPAPNTLKGKRDRAILAVLLGCGLRRRDLLIWISRSYSSARNIGPSVIWSAKAVTFEPCLCPSGSKQPSTAGRLDWLIDPDQS